MAKSRVNLTIDPYTHEKAKDVYDSFSKRVEELVEADLDVQNIDDPELIRNEISEKEEELEAVEDELEGLRKRKERLEADLSTARATLEKKVKEKESKDDALARFKEVFERKDKFSEDQKDFWKNETGLEWPELMEKVES